MPSRTTRKVLHGLHENAGRHRAFTVVELLIVVVILAILAAIVVVAYQGIQRRSADSVTVRTVSDALKNLQVYYANNRAYPSNVADTEYKPPLSVAVKLRTDAPQSPVYSSLTPDQNAQLFLNTCNGFMPTTDGTSTYNTVCVYNGNNAHVKGTVSSNVVIHGPSIEQSDFVLTCGSNCTTAQNNIISTFLAQGGKFPVIVPKAGSTLPAPTMQNTGDATRFCIQGQSAQFTDIMYHSNSEKQLIESGPCPDTAELHYP